MGMDISFLPENGDETATNGEPMAQLTLKLEYHMPISASSERNKLNEGVDSAVAANSKEKPIAQIDANIKTVCPRCGGLKTIRVIGAGVNCFRCRECQCAFTLEEAAMKEAARRQHGLL
jgi:hypothetical protein